MKLNKYFIAGSLLAVSMSFTSCVGDLDLLPTNPNDLTAAEFPEDPEGYMREVFADVFLNLSTFGPNGSNILQSMDGGMSTFQRSVFNLEEVPSDEASWIPSNDAIPHTWQYGEFTVDETVIRGAFNRMMLICSLANQFIQTDFGLQTAEQEALREEFVREVKILRSGVYFYLISNFGNVPLNDENVLIGAIPPQLSTNYAEGRRLVTEAVVNTLEEIVTWYKENDPNNNPPYGYLGLDVAEALLVKYYLNYEVFTGTPAWQKCFDHAQSLISRRGNGGFNNTGLATSYFQNFCPNNKEENEIIWRIVSQNADTNTDSTGSHVGVLNWANGGLMMMGWIGNDDAQGINQLPQYNSGQGWKCIVARRQFVEVFDWNADYTVSPDKRVTWWATAKDGFNINNPDLDYDNWGNNGYLAVKYTNWYQNADGSISASRDNFYSTNSDGEEVQTTKVPVNVVFDDLSPIPLQDVQMDYGMIRLAEIYLSAAEAGLYIGQNDAALKYVNYVRQRAGMAPYTTINLTELRNERQRELYTECTRRTDLVRYGLWVSGYNWNWKYHAPTGTDFPARMVVYPIPQIQVTNAGYVQNPGY